ncbi:MAG: alpha/beta hydrolase [Mycobacterium sp.]
MVDRLLLWLGAGVLTAGVTAAMIAGAGAASAQTESESDGGAKSSQEAKPAENKPDSDEDKPGPDQPSTPEPDDEGPRADAKDPAAEDDVDAGKEDAAEENDQKTAKPETGNRAARLTNTFVATLRSERERKAVVEKADPVAKADTRGTAGTVENIEPIAVTIGDPDPEPTPTPAMDQRAVTFAAFSPAESAMTLPTPMLERATAAATAGQPQIPGVIRVIGTIVFNLYAVATRLVGGPPIIPANSSVTVRSSTLVLDCGCDEGDQIEVPADWYIPEVDEGEPPPDRLIYLQHGFLASGPWYSHTAAALAEETDSIVVAPSITSNFLAADACWLGAPPMHQAIANLFEDNNPALAESALAAGYSGPIPQRVVLIGHSLGGGAVAGTAGYMVDNNTIDELAGVIMLDGVGLDDTMAASIAKVPDEIPIYQLAAPKYFWNQFGVGTDALLEARPGEFIGVTLVGGSHVDAMRGGNPLIQFSQQLVSGFSKPQNVAAARILMVGWANDMFADNQEEGIYAEDLTEEIPIDTPAGRAIAVPLPNSLEKPFLLNPLQALVPLGTGFFTFEPTCVAESMGVCTESIAA